MLPSYRATRAELKVELSVWIESTALRLPLVRIKL